ncbi:hypothetical protein [Mesorhizobium comanense]|uniref:hypothetical protein n=1 Tax=Mesorhizobium comanense TaxID=2502215 RepID=UPI0010F6694B|nr:hypothetical protein [Mesorhizobium comanense]
MLALIKSDQIIGLVAEGASFSHDGSAWTMPGQAGWELDGYTLVPVADPDPMPDGKISKGSTV